MFRKSYSLFVVVIVVAALALSQLACSGSGGGGNRAIYHISHSKSKAPWMQRALLS